jgi:hypothetical protein
LQQFLTNKKISIMTFVTILLCTLFSVLNPDSTNVNPTSDGTTTVTNKNNGDADFIVNDTVMP